MEQEIKRLIEKLHELEPGSLEYSGILADLEQLVRVRRNMDFNSEFVTPGELPANVPEKADDPKPVPPVEKANQTEATPVNEELSKKEPAVEEAASEKAPAEAPKKTPGKKTETEQPKLEAAFVRGELAKARRKGVNVTEIVTSFGVDNFKDIPAERYPEILEKLKEVS